MCTPLRETTMEKTVSAGILIGVIVAAIVASTVVVNVEKVSAPTPEKPEKIKAGPIKSNQERSASFFAPGHSVGDTIVGPANEVAPGNQDDDANEVAPGNMKEEDRDGEENPK